MPVPHPVKALKDSVPPRRAVGNSETNFKSRAGLSITTGTITQGSKHRYQFRGWFTHWDRYTRVTADREIETELKDVDRIRANRCTQLCPGSPFGTSHSHNIIYYSLPADSPPSRKETPRWRVLYRIAQQLLHCARCWSFSQKIETAKPSRLCCLLCRISCELAGCVHQPKSTIVG